MLADQVPNPQHRASVAQRVAEFLVGQGVPPGDDAALKSAILDLSKRSAPMDLGTMHPALKAYAYIQAIRAGGAVT